MKKTIVLLAVASLTACKVYRPLAVEKTDSVHVQKEVWTEYVHDTLYWEVPSEKVTSVTPDSSHLETDFAVSDAYVNSDGMLFHVLFNKKRSQPIPFEKPVVHVDSTTDRVTNEKTVVEVPRELNGWQVFQIRGFWVLFAIAVVYTALKIMMSRLKKF